MPDRYAVEAWLSELRPYEGEPGTSSGWRLAKSSWRLIRTQASVRTLSLALAVLFAAYGSLGVVAHIDLGVRTSHESLWPLRLGAQFLALLVANMTFIAIVAAADASLDGMRIGVSEALAEAREVVGPTAVWTAASIVYFTALGAATRSGWLGLLAFLVWYFASFFVLPALLIDGAGALGALAESVGVLRRRWRSALGVGLWTLVVLVFAFVVAGIFIEHAQALEQEGHQWRGFAAIALIPIMAISALVLAGQQIASLLVLRESFEDLRGAPWAGPRRGRGAKVLRVCGGVLVFFVLFGAIGAVTKHDRKVVKESNEPGANYSIVLSEAGELPSGSPILFEGRPIGVVLGSSEEDGGLGVRIHVEPGYGPESTPGSFRIVNGPEGSYLAFEPAGSGSGIQPEVQQS
jgi:hypothetical protein